VLGHEALISSRDDFLVKEPPVNKHVLSRCHSRLLNSTSRHLLDTFGASRKVVLRRSVVSSTSQALPADSPQPTSSTTQLTYPTARTR
jgi:hypothetical protein